MVLQLFVASMASLAASAADTTLVTTVGPDTITLQVPVSAISLTFPKGGLKPDDEPRSGAQGNPRYFHFADDARGLIVSGWIESSRSFQGYDKFWAGEFAAMKQAGITPTSAPSFVKAGDWIAAAYEVTIPGKNGSVNTHLRAELLQENTWVDLHISLTASISVAEARSVALRFLNSIEVAKK